MSQAITLMGNKPMGVIDEEHKGWLSGGMPSDEVITLEEKKQRITLPEQNRPRMAVYDAAIRDGMARGLAAKAIHDRLKADPDFQASYYAVWRYVRKVKGVSSDAVVMHIETDPGEEAQVVFGLQA